jgi:hypothetical protein
MPCEAHLVEVHKAYERIQQSGAQVLVISMSEPAVLQQYLAQNPYPFPITADPKLESYRQFGLRRAGVMSFFRPRVLLAFLRLIWRGGKIKLINKGEDPMQLGGDFILDRQQRLKFAHPSRDATDRPPLDLLLQELDRLNGV